MEADSPPLCHSTVECPTEIEDDSLNRRLSNHYEETDADNTIHGFNSSNGNVTVIETNPRVIAVCEGSDSGVEVLESSDHTFQRALSSTSGNSQDFDTLTGARSCDSSIISCCLNYEDAYNILVRRNSTLIEDYTLRNGDRTSENGSESSSVAGSSSSRNSKRVNSSNSKKKVNLQDTKKSTIKERSRSKPPQNPRRHEPPARLKSLDRVQGKTPKKPVPNSLDLPKPDPKRPSSARATKTPTPTDDGRWPSINSKPAPLMSRSLRAILDAPKLRTMDTKTIEKYATLPRRRKEKSGEEATNKRSLLSVVKRPLSRETTPSKTSTITRRKQKVKIYHETSSQTALTITDVNKALAGLTVAPVNPSDVEKCDKNEQVDMSNRDIEVLQAQIKVLTDKYEGLQGEYKRQSETLQDTETRLRQETVEKDGLKEELKNNSERVLAILGHGHLNDGKFSNLSPKFFP